MSVYFKDNLVDKLIFRPRWQEYNVQISEKFTKIGVNELEFRYEYAESPKDHGINNGARKLAVAFD